jgi:hypothetical protein
MTTKECKVCGEVKAVTEFSGRELTCKVCKAKAKKEYARSRVGRMEAIYSQNKATAKAIGRKIKSHPEIHYNLEAFKKWCYSTDYLERHEYWVTNNYSKETTPNVVRISKTDPFNLKNIKLNCTTENDYQAKKRANQSVDVYDLDGSYFASFDTVQGAVDYVNNKKHEHTEINKLYIDEECVLDCCELITIHAGRHQFRFKGDAAPGIYAEDTKAVHKLDSNGNVLKSYSSVTVAAREERIYKGNISSVCRGDFKQAGGFGWAYV